MSELEALFRGELEDPKPKDEEEHSDQDTQTLSLIINIPLVYTLSCPKQKEPSLRYICMFQKDTLLHSKSYDPTNIFNLCSCKRGNNFKP